MDVLTTSIENIAEQVFLTLSACMLALNLYQYIMQLFFNSRRSVSVIDVRSGPEQKGLMSSP